MTARRSRRRHVVDDGVDVLVIGWSPEASCWRVLFRGARSQYLDWFVPFSLSADPDGPPFAVGRCGRDEAVEVVASRLLRLPPPPEQREPGELVVRLSEASVN